MSILALAHDTPQKALFPVVFFRSMIPCVGRGKNQRFRAPAELPARKMTSAFAGNPEDYPIYS